MSPFLIAWMHFFKGSKVNEKNKNLKSVEFFSPYVRLLILKDG